MTKKQQITQFILGEIGAGRLKKGARLPSIRQLSRQFSCSKDTVSKALVELTYQHVIYSIPQSGYYVLTEPNRSQPRDSPLIDFSNSMPDAELFPYDNFRFCLNQAMIDKDPQLFTYYLNHQGLTALIDSLHLLLANYQVSSNKEQIIVTSGIQQALYILVKLPFPNGKDTILLDEPTYHMLKQLIIDEQIPYTAITRTTSGLDLFDLEKAFKTGTIKFFYTTPRFHNPLGTAYSLKEKRKIVTLAQKYDVYLVEDDYLADFDLSKSNDPLFYHDQNQRTVYLKSFSKIIFPALRLGCVVLPTPLISAFIRQKKLIDYDTSLIPQKALSLYIDSGMFQKHTDHLKMLYYQKSLKLQKCLAAYDLDSRLSQTTLDTKTTFQLKDGTNLRRLKSSLLHLSLKVDFLDANYFKPPTHPVIKIDVSNMPLEEIEANLKHLLPVIGEHLL